MSQYVKTAPATVDVTVLQHQLEVNTVIQQGLVSVTYDGGELILEFADDLTQTEETELDALLAAHTAADVDPKQVKLARYVSQPLRDKWAAPLSVNFETGLNQRLYREHYIVKGELLRIRYYAESSMNQDGSMNYSDLILEENISYTRDADGFALARTTEITWYLEDGTAHPTTKTLHKYYPGMESMVEGKRRRGNVVDQLQIDVAKWLIMTQTDPTHQERMNKGRVFFKDHALDCGAFVDVADRGVVTTLENVSAATYPWLEDLIPGHPQEWTIRQGIVEAIDIWDISTIV